MTDTPSDTPSHSGANAAKSTGDATEAPQGTTRGRKARPAAWAAAAGMGIGSAALVAALLYTDRTKPRDDRKTRMPPAMEKDQPES